MSIREPFSASGRFVGMEEAEERSLFRTPDDPSSPRQVKTSLALQFMHRVVGLDHLHYGLWDEADPLDVKGLRVAQDRFAQRLLGLIPDETRSVLDVGCGTGELSRAMSARGLKVEGLSPDPYQRDLYARKLPDHRFHLGRFQEFEPDRTYDLVMSCESAQYVWLSDFFPAVRRSAPHGSLLLCDYFRVAEGTGPLAKSGHPLKEFLRTAAEEGFVLDHQEDVTADVLPTLELGRAWLERYVRPTLELLDESSSERFPRTYRWGKSLGRRLFAQQIRRLQELEQLLDVGEFGRLKRYLVLRFRGPGT